MLFFSLAGSAQSFIHENYILKHWDVDDGLPVNEIVSIAQTHDGYLWLATFDGLIRFDGDQFTVFNTGNTGLFPTNRFIELYVDRHNNLWILSEAVQNNEVLMTYRDGSFNLLGSKYGLKGEMQISLSPKGEVMIGTENGAYFFEEDSLLSFGDVLLERSVKDIAVEGDNKFWFATDKGVYLLDSGVWSRFTEQQGLDSKNTYAVYPDSGDIWIASDKGINILRGDTIESYPSIWPRPVDRYVEIQQDPNRKDQMILINDGHFIYSFSDGKNKPYLNRTLQGSFKVGITMDQSGSLWSQMSRNLYRNDILVYQAETPINYVFHDKLGNVWVAQRDGLTQLRPRLIKAYSNSVSTVYTLAKSTDGDIWATQNHTNVFHLENGIFTKVNGQLGIPVPRPTYAIYSTSERDLWIGTVNGVFYWDKKNPVRLIEPPDSTELPKMMDIKAIHRDVYGNMWFGGTNGLHRLDPHGNWQHIGSVGNDNILGVRLIYETKDSTLWFGTRGNGLLHLEGDALQQIDRNNGLSGNIIRSAYEDREGTLWVGTEGWGLNRLERSTTDNSITRVTVFEMKNGLFDNVIHQILEDDQGRLWMNSNRGVFWVNLAELTAFDKGKISTIYSFFYNEQDGLPGREGNGGVQPAGFKTREGELWFPMMGGVARIDPSEIMTSPLNVFIEEIRVSDSIWHVASSKTKTFPKDQRDLLIRYAAIDFSTSPDNIRYRYKLEGYRDHWFEAGSRKEAIFNNLAPGTYTFRLIANNGSGWNKNETTLQIILPHYFYETNWFFSLIILFVAVIVYLIVNFRIRLLKQKGRELEKQIVLRTQDLIKEKEETERQKEIVTEALQTIEKQTTELKELDQAKSRFFTNISHEFRTPLTLIIGPLENQIEKLKSGLLGDQEEMEIAMRNSKRLLRLVNQILEVAKLESGHTQLQLQLVDIQTVIEPVVDAFRSLAERNGTRFYFEYPEEPVMLYIDSDLIEKAIINLLSNAFKFTPKKGKIKIYIRPLPEHVIIGIKDSGPGIPKDARHHIFERFYQVNESTHGMQAGTGIGLSLVFELVHLHQGTIELISDEGQGSEFQIVLGRGTSHLQSELSNQVEKVEVKTEGTIQNIIDTASSPSPVLRNTEELENNDKPILLIVDDNADIRAYVRKNMEADFGVIEAGNGLEGFELTQKRLPDLVISDVMMPISDGHELCRKIKHHPDLGFIPVILLTARVEKSMKIEGLEKGADDYVIKPFEIDELKARVHNLIQSRKKLLEHLRQGQVRSKSSDNIGWIDTPFVNRVRKVIEHHIGEEDFNVVLLAEEVNVSRTTLYSRIVEMTGKTPSEIIKLTRLYEAAQLLKEEAGNISEIAYATGFKNISHFSKSFKREFGISPTQYTKAPANPDQSF